MSLPPSIKKLTLDFAKNPTQSPTTGTKITKNSPRYHVWKERQSFVDDRAPSPDKPTVHSMVWLHPSTDPASLNYYLEGTERFSDLQTFRPDPRNNNKITTGEKYPAILSFKEGNDVNGDEIMILQEVKVYTKGGNEHIFRVIK